jgi:hypothetical protein
MRERNSIHRLDANAKSRYAITEPPMLNSRTGRRPMRSDSAPHNGAKKNCISE